MEKDSKVNDKVGYSNKDSVTGITDKKEEKKSQSDELLPLWCAPASNTADTNANKDGLAPPTIDAEQPKA